MIHATLILSLIVFDPLREILFLTGSCSASGLNKTITHKIRGLDHHFFRGKNLLTSGCQLVRSLLSPPAEPWTSSPRTNIPFATTCSISMIRSVRIGLSLRAVSSPQSPGRGHTHQTIPGGLLARWVTPLVVLAVQCPWIGALEEIPWKLAHPLETGPSNLLVRCKQIPQGILFLCSVELFCTSDTNNCLRPFCLTNFLTWFQMHIIMKGILKKWYALCNIISNLLLFSIYNRSSIHNLEKGVMCASR